MANPTQFSDVTLSVNQLRLLVDLLDHPLVTDDYLPQVAGLKRAFALALADCERCGAKREQRATSLLP